MANTLNVGNGNWATKEDSLLAYNSENGNFKPLPFDFTRASSATVVNKAGLIETVGSGEPRIDFLGNTKGALKLEPQRTNLITYSEAFDNSYWSKSGVSVVGGFASPSADSPLGAFKLVATTNDPYIYKTGLNVTANTQTASIYVKGVGSSIGKEGRFLFWYIGTAGGTTLSVPFTLTSDWQRVQGSSTPTSGGTIALRIDLPDVSVVGEEVLIYGAQLEEGSYATSYIPTSGQSGGVTRVQDTSSQTLPSSVFNSYPFSVFAEVDVVDTNTGSAFSLLNQAISTNYFTIEYFSNVWHITARPNGAIERIASTSTVTKGTYKLVGVWESTSMKLYLNGSLIASGSNSQSFNINVDSLLLGQLRISGDTGTRNTVIQTDLYNTALTDAEAIALTTI